MGFDDGFIDQVRNGVSLVGLIGEYVRLRKSGKDYAGLCPFHQEKTPSFHVSEGKQIFKCFGCGAGGDVFKFLMLMESYSFPESVEHVARRAGIPLPRHGKAGGEQDRKRSELFEVMEAALEFFRRSLTANNEAMSYLKGRGIEEETVETFAIGYAPPGACLMDHLLRKGFDRERLLGCGLLGESDGRHYDRFRNRILFPIRNLSGRPLAFGGRILGDGNPKYLNSPETPLYIKSRCLFGLDLARDEIRRRDLAVLVEGYFDCVVPHQFGFRNVVATLGTSLTREQVALLGRYTSNVVLNFDPDTAGTAAALRSVDLFLEEGFRVNVLSLPGGEDPDSFLRREGGEAYRERLKASQSFLDFTLERLMERHSNPYLPRSQQEVVAEVAPLLSKVRSPIERSGYVTRVASRLRLKEELVLAELRRRAPSGRRRTVAAAPPRSVVTPAEERLVRALFDPNLRDFVLRNLQPEILEGLQTERIFREGLKLTKRNADLSIISLGRELGQGEELNLLERLTMSSSVMPATRELVEESLRALRKKQLARVSHQIQDEIQKAEGNGASSGSLDELFERKRKLRRRMELDFV